MAIAPPVNKIKKMIGAASVIPSIAVKKKQTLPGLRNRMVTSWYCRCNSTICNSLNSSRNEISAIAQSRAIKIVVRTRQAF